MTECDANVLQSQPHGRREIVAKFNGEMITSDAGVLLLREANERLGLISRLAECFDEYRNPDQIDHPLEQLPAQRVFGIALGYEDLNDHDKLRHDPLLALFLLAIGSDRFVRNRNSPHFETSGSF